MHLSRWMLTGVASMFGAACGGGLLVGDPDGGPSTSTTSGSGGSNGVGGGTTVPHSTTATGTTASGAGGASTVVTAGTGGMGPTGTGDAGGGGPATPCEGWTSDPAFSTLRLDNVPLGRVYDVWGLSDNDYYVALGPETASWPNSSPLAAVAHFDGQSWTLDRLPATGGIGSLTGSVQPQDPQRVSQLWALAGVPGNQLEAAIFRNAGALSPGTWTTEIVKDPAYGLFALGDEDAILSVYTNSNAFIGDVRRWNGMQWVHMNLPDVGFPYALRRIRMRDATHVYAVAYSGGPDGGMGSHVLAAFDGSEWRARVVPEGCGNLEDVVGVAPDRIYTVGIEFSISRQRICRVSPDLATWNVVDDLAFMFEGERPSLVASGGGAVLTIVGAYMSHGSSSVRTMRDEMSSGSCSLTPGLGGYVAWSAPGSPNVHIFTGEQAGVTMSFARHLVARVDR